MRKTLAAFSLWLKIFLLVAYPLVTWITVTLIMVVVYGVPGL
jgi:hypothetical protein